MRSIVFCTVLASIIVACANKPLPATPVAGAPCGVSYVTCMADGKPTGACCDENTVCCTGATCPAGMCDYFGDDGMFAEHRLTKQWRAGEK